MALFAVAMGCAEASLGPPGGDGGVQPSCGNGRLDPGEACDDGNQKDSDGCVGTCVMATCGDGFVQLGVEACDDGNLVEDDACTTSCQGWQYRAPVTFEAAATGANVPVLVVLEPSSFMYAHAAADGSDLRIGSDDDGSMFDVPHWIESWTASGASFVWARVPAVAAGTNTIWLFYGHSSGVAAASDFATVFPDTLRTTGAMALGGAINRDAVIVEAGHTVTVPAGAPLAITAHYVHIAGTINANAAGYAAAAGPGPGGPSTNAGAGGGGHGGAGGAGGHDSGDTPGAAGGANGDATAAAIDMGSGGGTTDVSVGGRGGGAVNIQARRIAVTGSITARGQNGTGSGRSSGGGSGGGVLLLAPSIAFTGTIAVDGGNGGSGADSVNDGGGGGGGGRIKLLHAGNVVETGTTTLAGGAGGLYGDTNHGRPGSPGTKHTGTSATLGTLPAIGAEERL